VDETGMLDDFSPFWVSAARGWASVVTKRRVGDQSSIPMGKSCQYTERSDESVDFISVQLENFCGTKLAPVLVSAAKAGKITKKERRKKEKCRIKEKLYTILLTKKRKKS
jgi:hypothetical protein